MLLFRDIRLLKILNIVFWFLLLNVSFAQRDLEIVELKTPDIIKSTVSVVIWDSEQKWNYQNGFLFKEDSKYYYFLTINTDSYSDHARIQLNYPEKSEWLVSDGLINYKFLSVIKISKSRVPLDINPINISDKIISKNSDVCIFGCAKKIKPSAFWLNIKNSTSKNDFLIDANLSEGRKGCIVCSPDLKEVYGILYDLKGKGISSLYINNFIRKHYD